MGTILKRNAATMPAVPVTESTAVVKVEEVLQAPETLGDFTGQEITIQLAEKTGPEEGQQAIFFTNGWLYGESIAVIEVGRSAPEDRAGLREQIAAANQGIADEKLQDRIARAQIVVAGRVIKVTPVPRQPQREPITEHSPDWWEATIETESVEKGDLAERSITVLFPKSTDEMWINSPKFEVGQEGLWILQRDQQEKGWPSLRRPGHTALDPLDFQQKEQYERVRTLIESSQ